MRVAFGGSAQLFQVLRVFGEFVGHAAQLGGRRAIGGGCADILGGAAQLEQPILQRGDLARGQHDSIRRQTAALDGDSAFVGALPAWLTAVLSSSSRGARLVDQPAAPAAVPGRVSSPTTPPYCFVT